MRRSRMEVAFSGDTSDQGNPEKITIFPSGDNRGLLDDAVVGDGLPDKHVGVSDT